MKFGILFAGVRILSIGYILEVSSLHALGEQTESPASTPAPNEQNILFSLSGTIIDSTPDISEESFSELEHLAQDKDDVKKWAGNGKCASYLLSMIGTTNCPNAMITLRGDHLHRVTSTDSRGRYTFKDLPAGDYMVTIQTTSRYDVEGSTQPLQRQMQIHVPLDNPRHGNFEVNALSVALRGRVLTTDGRPVGNAKVLGIPYEYQLWDDPYSGLQLAAGQMETQTDAEGFYEFKDLIPLNLYVMVKCSFIGNGNNRELYWPKFYEIHVEADGYTQDSNNIPKIPPISENLMIPTRRLFSLVIPTAALSEEDKSKISERSDIPRSEGNTIKGIDIVVNRVDAHSPPSAEVPPASD